MDYRKMIEFHREKDADLTIAAQPVEYEEAHRFGILDCQEDKKIIDFLEKPENPPSNLASMGIYVFNTDALLNVLEKYCSEEDSDFGHHIIPPMIENDKVYLYSYDDYWKDVGTLEAYWQAHLELTDPMPDLNLYDEEWKLFTRSEEKPPVKFGENGGTEKSLISNGAIINGKVKNSVISPGVYIEEGAVVKDSVIFNDTIIRKNTVVEKAIIDKEVEIGENCKIGYGDDYTPNKDKPDLLDNGLNIIAKRAKIPEGTTIERNCRIFSYAAPADFGSKDIKSGSTITSEIGHKLVKGDEDQVRELNI
jgi:glucose-1-phosphate adenylyltransferase